MYVASVFIWVSLPILVPIPVPLPVPVPIPVPIRDSGFLLFQTPTMMGSIFGHGIDSDLCSTYFAGPSVMGRMQNARRE